MAKLKPLSIGLTLGAFFTIIYTLYTIAIWLFPNFVVNLVKKVTYNMAAMHPAVITIDAFAIGLIDLFVEGFILGIVFAWVYNWVNK